MRDGRRHAQQNLWLVIFQASIRKNGKQCKAVPTLRKHTGFRFRGDRLFPACRGAAPSPSNTKMCFETQGKPLRLRDFSNRSDRQLTADRSPFLLTVPRGKYPCRGCGQHWPWQSAAPSYPPVPCDIRDMTASSLP